MQSDESVHTHALESHTGQKQLRDSRVYHSFNSTNDPGHPYKTPKLVTLASKFLGSQSEPNIQNKVHQPRLLREVFFHESAFLQC